MGSWRGRARPSRETRTPMPSTPPRRRAQRPPDDTGLPLVPILIGVIVLGFVIGAGWSLLSNRHGGNATTVALATATPQSDALPSVTPVPGPSDTLQPAAAPSPEMTTPRPTPVATHTPKRAASPAPTPSVPPTVAARSTPLATKPPTASAVALATRAAGEVPPPPPVIRETARASATPLASATAADVSRDFSTLAAAVVRQYLEAVKRGDSTAAYAALGAAPGDRGAALTETGIVDARTRIGRIDSHGNGDTATVEVDLQTAGGPYYGEYTVRKNDTGAAVIVQHSLVKP